jgi:hypothetical protein
MIALLSLEHAETEATKASTATAGAVIGTPRGRGDVGSPRVAEVDALLAAGDREAALRLVTRLRRDGPDDARLAAVQARLYFEKLRWSDGVGAYRFAVRSDPALAGDPVLVSHVIRSLQSSQFHERGAAFLEELGEPVRPQLEEAARNHPSPSVRSRAAQLLRSWPRLAAEGEAHPAARP